jgi:hypothetical protein
MTGALRAGAVIVNYNCAPLALDAALSFLGAAGEGGAVVIVDNASTDGSRDYFRAVARGGRHHPEPPPAPAPNAGVSFAAPTALKLFEEGEAEGPPSGLSVLFAASNRGFAAGCNLGLRALAPQRFDLLMLLNPDALVARPALAAFARRLEDTSVGLCGATVLGFNAPHDAQAFGGARLNPLTLAGANLGAGLSLEDAPARGEIESRLDYPLGPAIAFRPDYLERAGFLDERYFLYFEEADWAFAGKSFARVGWAEDAVIYHRYGASSKSERPNPSRASNRSPLSDYHMARSRLLFALKWRPHLAPLMVAMGSLQAARRLLRGRLRLARAVALGSLPGAARAFRAR